MKVIIALTVAVFGFATFSKASEAHQKIIRTTHKDEGTRAMKKDGDVDVVNKIQLEDQVFWKRTLSMSIFNEGDSLYWVSELMMGVWGCVKLFILFGIAGDIFRPL